MMMVTTDMCQVEAVSTQVKFSKECDKQMVTVCQPQPAYSAGAYTTVQHCKEVRVSTLHQGVTVLNSQGGSFIFSVICAEK